MWTALEHNYQENMSYQPPKRRSKEDGKKVEASFAAATAAKASSGKGDAKGVFLRFLAENGVNTDTPIASSSSSSLEQVVEDLFDELDEELMRKISDKAIEVRNTTEQENIFGQWGEIIDAFMATTVSRRERAGEIFEKLVNIGREGNLKNVQIFIQQLYASGNLDRLLVDLVQNGLETFEKQGNDEYAAMFRFFSECFIRVKKFMGKEGDKANRSDTTSADQAPPPLTKKDNTIPASPPPPLPVDSPAEQRELLKAGIRLDLLLKESNKDVAKLKAKAESECKSGKIDKYFLRVLDDNIAACKQANYENKTKLLTFLKSIVENALNGGTQRGDENDEGNVSSTDASTSHHAPQFIGKTSSVAEESNVLTPDNFIAKESEKSLNGLSKAKAKDISKANKKKKDNLAESLSKHLDTNGWAVCDGFLSLDLVRRVRIEAELFNEFYEESEIWVGKQADVGAHLSVPSVRGDKVLWMCGAHRGMAPEGVTRHIKTKGELEPCKLKVKAHAPMRKFAALKELVTACDGLIDDMKPKVENLKGIYERSDAMLAVYPGGGSRFARHIDNTTGDGRRLTLLIYLNPDWTKEMGGALRLTTRLLARKVEEESEKGSILEMDALAAGIDEIGVESIHKNSNIDESSSSGNNDGGTCGTSFNSNASSMFIDVYPNAGRLAMFYSAETAHEVLPTFDSRYAITIWYYDYNERDQAIKDSTESGRAQEISKTTIEDQKEAKAFIAVLMGGDEVGEDGGNPTKEELILLAKRVVDLSDSALGIVASITGAPSVQSFRDGFKMLVPEDLKSMRQLFRRMGLNQSE